MRSVITISLALIFILSDGNLFVSNAASAFPEIREMSPSELATAEKEASKSKVATLQRTPSHIPFDEHHFNYSSEEWTPVKLPKDHQFDPLDAMMMNVLPSNPNKQVKLSLDLPNNSSVVVRYFVFLTKNEKSPPEFKVLLSSSDGMDRFLKIEEPAGRWMNSSVEVRSEIKDKIVFVAKLREATNEIGLRFVTIQKASGDVEDRNGAAGESRNETGSLDRAKTDNSSLPQLDEHDSLTYNYSSKVNNDTVNLLNDTNSTLEDTRSKMDNISVIEVNVTTQSSALDEENITSTNVMSSTVTNPSFQPSNDKENENMTLPDDTSSDKFNLSPKASNDSILPTELSPSINSSLKKNDTTSSGPIGPIEQPVDAESEMKQTVANGTLGEGSIGIHNDDAESSLGIFHFFLVIMLSSTAIFLFIYIRRKRRRRDDELPVFRTGTELGNPTYLDDETEMDIRFSSSNYRSFK